MVSQPVAASYPPAPWRLAGECAIAAMPAPLEASRARLPAGLAAVPVAPGWTVGGILLARYRGESTLDYDELIVFSGLARRGWRVGGWISHIYVDLEESVAGGREIWGLPKELVEFDWGRDGKVEVVQGGRTLLRAHLPTKVRRAPLPLLTPEFGARDGRLLHGFGSGWMSGFPAGCPVEVPPDSPLSVLRLGASFGALVGRMDLSFRGPTALDPTEV